MSAKAKAKVQTRATELAVVTLLICKRFKTLGIRPRFENTHICLSDQLHVAVKASRVLHASIKPHNIKFHNLSNPVRTEPIDCVGTASYIINCKYVWI